jgi:hypothetical protein
MTTKNLINQDYIYCPECRTVISFQEIFHKINVSLDYFFCPTCGKKINLIGYNLKGSKKANYSVAISLDEEAVDSAINFIKRGMRFTHNFHKTLHHLIARTCVFTLQDLGEKQNLSLQQIRLTEELLELIEKQLEPLITKKPFKSMLNYLNLLSYEEFTNCLRKYQKKLKKRRKYRDAFFLYQRWIIIVVYKFLSNRIKYHELDKPEKIICDDIIEYFNIDITMNSNDRLEHQPSNNLHFNPETDSIDSDFYGVFNNKALKPNSEDGEKMKNSSITSKKFNRANEKKRKNDLSYNDYHEKFTTKLTIFCEKLKKEFKKEIVTSTSENVSNAFLMILKHFDKNLEKGFDLFYEKLGYRRVRSAKYLVAGLLLLFLRKEKIKISQKKLASLLYLNIGSLQNITSRLKDILKSIEGFEFVFKYIKISKLELNEYLYVINLNLQGIINDLNQNLNDYILVTSEILEIIKEIFSKIEGKNKFNKFQSKIERITPLYIASSLCYLYLKYSCDLKISKEDFISKIKIKIKKSTFNTVSNQLEKVFLRYYEIPYKEKVDFYINYFINELRNWIHNKVQNTHNRNKYIQELKKNSVFEQTQYLYYKAKINGFENFEINKNNEVSYYFPQQMAVSLFYYSLKKSPALEEFASENKISDFLSIDSSFIHHIADKTSNRLYKFLVDELGHYKGQIYTRETFIKLMEKRIRKFYHIETDFLLRLYKATDLSPTNFGNKLLIHNTPGTSGVLRIIKERTSFTEPQTFKKIKIFINKYVESSKDRLDLIKLIKEIKKSRSKDFLHQGVTYRFNFMLNRIKNLNNSLDSIVSNFFLKIWEDKFPRNIFLDGKNPRVSTLKFLGTSQENIKTEEIRKFFNPYLNQILLNYKLCKYVKEIYDLYRRNKYGKKPKHPPVLSYIIINEKNCVGSEVPVWLKITDKYLIGHIDLVLINNNEIMIGDYKKNMSEIFKSIPQITAYAILLNKRLFNNDNRFNIKFKCIGFCKRGAIIFNPFIIQSKILEFIQDWNNRHNHNLTTRKYSKRIGKFDLFNLWKDFISN